MPVVVAVQIWYSMNPETSVLDYTLEAGAQTHDWYATTFSPLSMATLLIVWGALPFVVITLYAALAQVPHDLVEVGGGRRRAPVACFRDITVPILKPILLILTSLSIIWEFGVFTQPTC